MAVESATYIGELDPGQPLGVASKSEGDNHLRLIKSALQATFPGLGGRAWRVQGKGSAYTALSSDNFTVIRATAAMTLYLTAAATLGNGWMCLVHAEGGDVTIDPNLSEVVNGSATLSLPQGSWTLLICVNDTATPMHFVALSAFSDVLRTGGGTVTGALGVEGTLTVGGASTIGGPLTVEGVGNISGPLNVDGASSELRLHDRTGGGDYNGLFRNADYLRINSGQGIEVAVLDDSGNLTLDGDLSIYSDAQLKENVHNLLGALGYIDALRPVTFVWKEGNGRKSGTKDMGLIAQEVQKVLPELVLENTAKDQPYLTVNYVGLVPVLCAALRELHREVKSLRRMARVLQEELFAQKEEDK